DARTTRENLIKRPDTVPSSAIVELIPTSASRILWLTGLSAGHALNQLEGVKARVTQAEVDAAGKLLIATRAGMKDVLDVDHQQRDNADETFDCVLCQNVLERVRDPMQLLKHAASLMQSDGELIAQVRSVRQMDVVSDLLEGTWSGSRQHSPG